MLISVCVQNIPHGGNLALGEYRFYFNSRLVILKYAGTMAPISLVVGGAKAEL